VIPGETPPAGAAQALAAFLPAFGPAGPPGSGVGLLFIILVGVAVSTAVWRETSGVSFGLWWLLILVVAAPGEPLPAGIGVALAASLALARIVELLSELARRLVPAGCACLLILSGLACGQTIDVLPLSADRTRVLQSRDPIDWLRVSAFQYNGGRFPESIAAASTALRLKPDSVDAYNNMCVAFASLKMWDQAIQASQEALRLKPGDPVARENLARAQEQKRRGSD
jgi:tetratricopeptide (TPR) repeat protein